MLPRGTARIPPGFGAPGSWPVDAFMLPRGRARMPPGTGAPSGRPLLEEPAVIPELLTRMGCPPPQLTTIVPELTGAGVPLLEGPGAMTPPGTATVPPLETMAM